MPTSARTYSRTRRPAGSPLLEKLFSGITDRSSLQMEVLYLEDHDVPRWTGEFWTPKQRQASSLHEISYRACFKPQLPRFFIERFTNIGDTVYDPFMGRGTTPIEAAMLGRTVVANDVNPLSKILALPRLQPPLLDDIARRLGEIPIDRKASASIDLRMFFHRRTEAEIVSLRRYLARRLKTGKEDAVDRWIRMVATNRLTGHSTGFFSVYTLPPNQAMSARSQLRVNKSRKQKPEYRDIRELILRKSRSLLRDVTDADRKSLNHGARNSRFLTSMASRTRRIQDESIHLTVTSPPFLDTVNYAQDNWMRGWFNDLDQEAIGEKITVVRTVDEWIQAMSGVFRELYRITVPGGVVAFEVGEIRKRNLRLDEVVVPIGIHAGFRCAGVLVNLQRFTKTSNIWGIHNNQAGTNTNRIVVYEKAHDD